MMDNTKTTTLVLVPPTIGVNCDYCDEIYPPKDLFYHYNLNVSSKGYGLLKYLLKDLKHQNRLCVKCYDERLPTKDIFIDYDNKTVTFTFYYSKNREPTNMICYDKHKAQAEVKKIFPHQDVKSFEIEMRLCMEYFLAKKAYLLFKGNNFDVITDTIINLEHPVYGTPCDFFYTINVFP